jgi:hypothetical protein
MVNGICGSIMPLKIIFNGPPGSGKDEACLFLESNHGFKHISFKKQLIDDAVEHFGVSAKWFMNGYDIREIKEKKETSLGNRSRREALIHVSEDIVKPKYGDDYYGKCVAHRLNSVADYCFSDGGFLSEVKALINSFGPDEICVVQLCRSGCTFEADSRYYITGLLQDEIILGTKTDIDQEPKSDEILPIRMYRIHNNATHGDFHQSIRTVLRKEANVKKEIAVLRKSIRH